MARKAARERSACYRPEVRDMQAAYLRKVIDTVNDLDSILYEVMNEGGNNDWDWWVVDFVHEYEGKKGKTASRRTDRI